MSRGIRDLRELICVSRLTYRKSDDEADLSDLSDSLSSSGGDLRNDGSSGHETLQQCDNNRCDSGIGTNAAATPETVTDGVAAVDLNDNSSCKKSRKTKRKRRKKINSTPNATSGYDLPKPEALPPLHGSSALSGSSSDSISAMQESERDFDGNFDFMFRYLDATLLSELLPKANEAVSDLSLWCHHDDNFIEFAHFLMTDFPAVKWQEILQLEHSILIDELSLLFVTAGRENGHVRYADLMKLVSAVFREYPAKLFGSRGSFLFLNYLDVLSSERTDSYKRLLTDVKLRTTNRTQAQWVLAIRAYALANIWSAVVTFYRRLGASKPSDFVKRINLKILKDDLSQVRIYKAIKRGFVDVVNYFIKSGKVDPRIQDEHQRSLVFIAVMHNQEKVLKFLLTQVKPKIDPHSPADSGNTPLHAAANSGNVALVSALIKEGQVDVNKVNKHCDNATALHMAVLHGHKEAVKVLLSVNADRSLKMEGLVPADIARDFGHEDILELFDDVVESTD